LPLAASCPQLASITSSPIAATTPNSDWANFKAYAPPATTARRKIIEQRGYDPAIGADGMPLDPRHPIYRYDKR
jgi:hypothetical protein